jgi:regulator of cell morphogenesis and NO signaling
MSIDWADVPVSTLVRERQGRVGVLEKFGIDYCCHGATTLANACRERGLSVEEVRRALEASVASPAESDEADWARESLQSLVDHIVARHHSYLREQLPRIGALLEKVIAKHADKHPSLVELRGVYAGLCNELAHHMMKEEQVLFPYIRLLEEARDKGQPAPPFHCGSVQQPIRVMEDEHRTAGDALRRMRDLTLGFQPPTDACDAYRKLMDDLRGLEGDLHLHIHKENNILFPRAAAVESSLQSPATHRVETIARSETS